MERRQDEEGGVVGSGWGGGRCGQDGEERDVKRMG